MKSRTFFFALAFCRANLTAQQDAAYIGASACGTCHPAQFARQSASPHAHALSPAATHRLAASFAQPGLQRPPRYHFEFLLSAGELRVKAFDHQDTLEIPIQWAFGAGEQAVTFVSRLNQDWYLEHYFSYYPAISSMAATPGQEGLRSNALPLAIGLQYRSVDASAGIIACFRCHSTGPPSIGLGKEVQPQEFGVRCESCHGPGSLHVKAVSSGQHQRARELIQNPKRMSAAGLNEFCGVCHRSPGNNPSIDLNKAWNVRHQPAYLSRSACFSKSNGRLSCLTCHDPHGKLERNAGRYNEKCARCHLSPKHSPAFVADETRAGACTDCHMPRIPVQPHLNFTNHRIAVFDNLQPKP